MGHHGAAVKGSRQVVKWPTGSLRLVPLSSGRGPRGPLLSPAATLIHAHLPLFLLPFPHWVTEELQVARKSIGFLLQLKNRGAVWPLAWSSGLARIHPAVLPAAAAAVAAALAGGAAAGGRRASALPEAAAGPVAAEATAVPAVAPVTAAGQNSAVAES